MNYCKDCGKFGKVFGGSKYQLCVNCLAVWWDRQAELFKKIGNPLDQKLHSKYPLAKEVIIAYNLGELGK